MLKVKADGQRDLMTVVGSLSSVNAGEWVTAQGRWVRDKEFGLQFRADLLSSTAPTTREGIEKYLGSGMVKGVGPVYAKKLVAAFGENIFHIIENCSARLEEVEGIGPKRRRMPSKRFARILTRWPRTFTASDSKPPIRLHRRSAFHLNHLCGLVRG